MKNLFLVLLISVFCTISAFAQTKTPIAVLSFEAKKMSQETADAVADLLSTELFNTNRFTVVERQAITRMLEEQQLQMTGVTDMSQAAEIGKILNVEKILIGSVSKFGITYIINTRIVDVQTGALEMAENVNSESGESGLPLSVRMLAQKIAQNIQIIGEIVRIENQKVIVDIGSDFGLKQGQFLEILRRGEGIAKSDGTIIETERRIGYMRIQKVYPDYAECVIPQRQLFAQVGDKVRSVDEVPENLKEKAKERVQQKRETKKKEKTKKANINTPPVF